MYFNKDVEMTRKFTVESIIDCSGVYNKYHIGVRVFLKTNINRIVEMTV